MIFSLRGQTHCNYRQKYRNPLEGKNYFYRYKLLPRERCILTVNPDAESEEVEEAFSLNRIPADVRITVSDEFLVALLSTA